MSEKQQQNEKLSAFIDAEQSDIEIAQVVDSLLKEPEYKSRYIRMQLVNDLLHDQIEQHSVSFNLQKKLAAEIDELPAYYVDDAVNLQAAKTENVPQSSLFQTIFGNRLVSGISVAASVMFVTLIMLQTFDSKSESSTADIIAGDNSQPPSLIQAPFELPATLVAASAGSIDNEKLKQQYQWIEADPELSRQVRKYINEHETHRATFSLQPKIRSANYQISE